MARTLNPEAHAVRRDCFVDAAQRLIQVRGYEQLSIQDVLDEAHASKGAFYHYFTSKEALLDAVLDRIVETALASVAPVVSDPDLSAIQKLTGLFSSLAQWKNARKELMLALLEVWLSSDNTVVREKHRGLIASRLLPSLTAIVTQGKAEGAFTVSSPKDAAGILVALIQGANEVASRALLARQAETASFADVERMVAAYQEAFERTLGAPAGSLTFIDDATLRLWYG